jgi:hypothetical protein
MGSTSDDVSPGLGMILIMGKFTAQCPFCASGNCHILAKSLGNGKPIER